MGSTGEGKQGHTGIRCNSAALFVAALGVQGAVETTATVHVLAVLAVCLDAHGTNIVAGHVLALCRRKCQWQA